MSEQKAEAIARRMAQIIEAWGQPVSIGRGGTTNTQTARVSAMSNVVKYAWFRSNETANWAAPAYVVTLAQSGEAGILGAVQVGDSVGLPQGVFTVRKLDRPRLGGVIFKTVLYVARDV